MKIQNTCCTPFIPPTPTDKNVIMYQLKPFKQYIWYKNKQIDDTNNIYDNNYVFSTTSRICKVCIETQNSLSDPDSCFIWS